MAHLHQQQQQTTHPSFHQPQYVTVLGANDVLLGRGSGPNDHEGNIQFRKYVAERKQAYMATNHRLTKTKIAREIVDLVACAGGRFLKKLEETPEQEVYEIVSDETVMEKAKQALRQNAGKKDGVAPVPPANTTTTTTHTPSSVNLSLGDLEPIPFTDAGYSGPPPAATTTTATQGDIAAVWQLQQQQQQAVATAAAFQQQQQQRRQQQQQQPNLFEQQLQQQQQQSAYDSFAAGGGAGGVQPYPYHQQQQQQRQMPPPLMRIPSIPTDQQQQQQLYGYSTSTDTSFVDTNTSAKSLTPSLVSSEGSGSVGGSSGTQFRGGGGRMNHKRASLTIADLSDPRRPTNHTARSSSQVEDLTDSFSKLNASTDNVVQNKMMASSDTMGTIDYHETSMADMSINSSTFSIFKGADNSSSALDLPNATARNQQFLLHSQQPHRNTISSPEGATIENNHRDSSSSTNRTRDSGDSMSFTDLFEKGGKSSSLSCSIGGLIHDIRRQVESEMGGQSPVRSQTAKPEEVEDEQHHPTLGPLRASSLDVVKSLLPTESEAAELGLQQQQQEQHSSPSGQQPQQQSSQQQRQAYYRQDPNRKAAGV